MQVSKTVGSFSFISNPNVRVLSFTAEENKSNELRGGFVTVISKDISTPSRPKYPILTKAMSYAWFRGRFNKELYDSVMEIRNR